MTTPQTDITVDAGSPVPAFDQIREQIGDRIRSGSLSAGQRLASIRQLAGDLRVAPGTVARAYRELEAAGLIESSRTSGTRVRPDQQADQDLHSAAARFVMTAQRTSTDLNDALSLVRIEWGRQHREA